MKKMLILVVVVLSIGLASLCLTSCSKAAPVAKTKVGVILPMTGILAEMGQYEKQAMELAMETLKGSGHDDIELVFEDGKGDNKVVAAAANRLLDVDKVRLVITSTTGASLTTQPICERQKIPLLAFCMSSDVAQKSPYTIRFYIGLEEEANALMSDLKSMPKETKVGILHANVAAFKTVVTDLYLPFLAKSFSPQPVVEEYSLSDKDFRSQLTKLKTAEVKVLILLGYGFEYPAIFAQMQGLAMKQDLQIIGGWGFLYTQLAANDLEGIKVAGPTYVFQAGAVARSFQESFEKRYGKAANFDAAFAYEVVRQLPSVLALVNQKGAQNIKAGLTDLGAIDGTFGKYKFTADGNMIAEAAVGTFKNGKITGN